MNLFPPDRVWHPTDNGFVSRLVTKADKTRRGYVLELITRPSWPRGYTPDAEVLEGIAERKRFVRELLITMDWPCHET